MAKVDATTFTEYNAGATPSAKAQAVVDALAGAASPIAVTVKIYNGSNAVMASGTMAVPWATQAGGTITVGELTSALTVATGGTPDATWRLEFASGSRFVYGTFGLPGSAREWTWSLPIFAAGQTATLGNVQLTSVSEHAPTWSGAPATLSVTAPVSYNFATYASDVDGGTLTYSLAASRNGITISSAGLLSVASAAAGTSGNITVRVTDPTGLYSDTVCAVTVQAVAGEDSPNRTVATNFTGMALTTYSDGAGGTDGWIHLSGTDTSMSPAYTWPAAGPQMWGHCIYPGTYNGAIHCIGTAPDPLNDTLREIVTLAANDRPPTGQSTAYRVTRVGAQTATVSTPQTVFELRANTGYPQGMFFARYWIRFRPGFFTGMGGDSDYALFSAKAGNDSFFSRVMWQMIQSGGTRYWNMASEYYDQSVTYHMLWYQSVAGVLENTWTKVEVAARYGTDASAWAWMAVYDGVNTGSGQQTGWRTLQRAGANCSALWTTKMDRCFFGPNMYNAQGQAGGNISADYTGWEVWTDPAGGSNCWPSDAYKVGCPSGFV